MIVFIDETGFSFQLGTGTTWAPKGQTPVLRRVSKRRQVSTAIGLTSSGGIYKNHFDHAIHGADMVRLLRHLRSRVSVVPKLAGVAQSNGNNEHGSLSVAASVIVPNSFSIT